VEKRKGREKERKKESEINTSEDPAEGWARDGDKSKNACVVANDEKRWKIIITKVNKK
jgi:hypothetical protein